MSVEKNKVGGWLGPLIIIVPITLWMIWLAFSSGPYLRERFQVRAGHDWSNFYYAKSLLTAFKTAPKSGAGYLPEVERRLKDYEFITDGKPGWTLLSTLFLGLVGGDFSPPGFRHDTGDNFRGFWLEACFYVLLLALGSVLITGIGRLLFPGRAGLYAGLLFLSSTWMAYYVIGWKIYTIPGLVFFLLSLYCYLKSLDNRRPLLWLALAGFSLGYAVLTKPKVIAPGAALIALDVLRVFWWGEKQSRALWRPLILLAGAAMIIGLYELAVWTLFEKPYYEVSSQWGLRSWSFIQDMILYGMTSVDLKTRIDHISWPAYLFSYLRAVEGPFFVWAVTGASIFGLIRVAGSFKRGYAASGSKETLGLLLALILGPVQVLAQTLLAELSGTGYAFYEDARTWAFCLIGLVLLFGYGWARLERLVGGKPWGRWIFAVLSVLFLAYQLGSVANMYYLFSSNQRLKEWTTSMGPERVVQAGPQTAYFVRGLGETRHRLIPLDDFKGGAPIKQAAESGLQYLLTNRRPPPDLGRPILAFPHYTDFSAWACLIDARMRLREGRSKVWEPTFRVYRLNPAQGGPSGGAIRMARFKQLLSSGLYPDSWRTWAVPDQP